MNVHGVWTTAKLLCFTYLDVPLPSMQTVVNDVG